MAIYHFEVSMVSRTKGHSSVEFAARCRGEKQYDARLNKVFNYTNKKEVAYHTLMGDMTIPWVTDFIESYQEDPRSVSELLWNALELNEKRTNAQLARKVVAALPLELSLDQNTILVRDYVKNTFVSEGMLCDVSIHWNEQNPNVQMLLTTRPVTPDGFSKRKERNWNTRAFLEHIRERWSHFTHRHLAKHNIEQLIDHRSYAGQGIDRIPNIRLGSAVNAMRKRGIVTERAEIYTNIKKQNEAFNVLKDPNGDLPS